jgi:leucyl aminopeptidase
MRLCEGDVVPESLIAAGSPGVPVEGVAKTAVQELKGETGEWVKATGFSGAAGEVALIPDGGGRLRRVLFGLGGEDASPLLAGKLATALPPGDYRLASGFADPVLSTLAFVLGAYRFTRYRRDERAPRRLAVPEGVDAAEVGRVADGVVLARDLVNTPANDMGPAELAAAARELAARHGATVGEVVGDRLLAEGFPLIHAVGAAAIPQRAPRLIDLTWGDPAAPKVTLVGKGVCFDTGGLDIKPSSNMLLMKKDMGGAANALGLAHMVMDAGLAVRLRVLIPAVENAISGGAFRPGDIFTSRSGISVEIGNTDAEGRLVLADALALAGEESPDLLVDLATLTGAARVALGPQIVPFYTGDDALAADLARHAAAVADPLWRMPLWQPYAKMLESKVADINNAGSGGFAGSITAALFLARFVADRSRWLHADIFAWNPSTEPGRPEGGEAQAIRALHALLAERYAGS